jgi:hypothetical protein
MENSPTISVAWRIVLWAAAWGAAAISVVATSPPGIIFWAWLFPVGLVGIFEPFVPQHFYAPRPPFTLPPIVVALGAFVILLAGWLPYIYLSIHALSQRALGRYFVIYAILIVLLFLNVVGCHIEIAQMEKANLAN